MPSSSPTAQSRRFTFARPSAIFRREGANSPAKRVMILHSFGLSAWPRLGLRCLGLVVVLILATQSGCQQANAPFGSPLGGTPLGSAPGNNVFGAGSSPTLGSIGNSLAPATTRVTPPTSQSLGGPTAAGAPAGNGPVAPALGGVSAFPGGNGFPASGTAYSRSPVSAPGTISSSAPSFSPGMIPPSELANYGSVPMGSAFSPGAGSAVATQGFVQTQNAGYGQALGAGYGQNIGVAGNGFSQQAWNSANPSAGLGSGGPRSGTPEPWPQRDFGPSATTGVDRPAVASRPASNTPAPVRSASFDGQPVSTATTMPAGTGPTTSRSNLQWETPRSGF